MKAALILGLSLLLPLSLQAQDIPSIGVSFGEPSLNVHGRLPASPVPFTIRPSETTSGAMTLSGPISDMRVFGQRIALQWASDIRQARPWTRHHSQPPELAAHNLRFGMTWQRRVEPRAGVQISGALEVGLSTAGGARDGSRFGDLNTGYAGVSLRAEHHLSDTRSIWLDLRYSGTGGMSMQRNSSGGQDAGARDQIQLGVSHLLQW